MARECPTPVSDLNQPGGTKGMWLTPHWQQLSKPAKGPSHSHPKPGPRLGSMRKAQWTGMQEVTQAVPFLNQT